jgi:hypothetical protein
MRLGTRLVPALLGDPAVLALAGVDPDLRPPPEHGPTAEEDAALDVVAATWAATTVGIVDGVGERAAADIAERMRDKIMSRGEIATDIVVVQGHDKETLRLHGALYSVNRVRSAIFNAAIKWNPIYLG